MPPRPFSILGAAAALVTLVASATPASAWSGAGDLQVESTGAYYRKDVRLTGARAVRVAYPFSGFPVGGHNYVGVMIGSGYIEMGYSDGHDDTAQAHLRQSSFKIDYARSELWIRDESSSGESSPAQRSSFRAGQGGYVDLPSDVNERLRLNPGDSVEQTVSGSNPLTNRIQIRHADGSRTIASWIFNFQGVSTSPASGALGASYRVILSTAKNPSDTLTAAERAQRARELSARLSTVEVNVMDTAASP